MRRHMGASAPSDPGLSPAAMWTEDESAFLFSELVGVHVKPVGRDEFSSSLTVRLRPDSIAHPRSLLVELTDEADLFFYHSLALGEGDFHNLKSEQRLLVDFQSFPAQLAELLRRCIEAAGTQDGSSKMLACLDCGVGGESVFSIVESNHFRELTHIALRLRQGSDDVVKQHLAGKLRTLRVESAELAERLRVTDEALCSSKRHVDELTARARVISEERTHLEKTLESTHQRELAELRSEHGRVLADNQRAAAEERARLEAELRKSLEAASARASKAEREVEELAQQRQTLTVSGDNCKERLEATEAKLRQATQEVLELKTQQKQSEALRFSHEKELAELKVQLAALREHVALREQHVASQATQIEEAAGQRRILEESLNSHKQQVQHLEEKFALSAQEIAKGNRIIQTLHATSKQAKAQLKLKAAELEQQERARLELAKGEDMTKRALDEKDHELSRAKTREERLEQDLEELRKKLAEAHEVLKSNQDVIEYLNRQLTERDLKAIPAVGGSGYKSASEALRQAGGSGTLAELLGRIEGINRATGTGAKGSCHTSSLGFSSLGISGTGSTSGLALGSSNLSAISSGLSGGLSTCAPPPSIAAAPTTPGSPPASQFATGPTPGDLDRLLKGPVAYRRPTQSAVTAAA